MDRSILEGDPHVVIEAMAIAAYAIGASQGAFMCVRSIPSRCTVCGGHQPGREYGLLGDDIFGTGFHLIWTSSWAPALSCAARRPR